MDLEELLARRFVEPAVVDEGLGPAFADEGLSDVAEAGRAEGVRELDVCGTSLPNGHAEPAARLTRHSQYQ